LAQANRPARRARPGGPARIVLRGPGASLGFDPILWREWDRQTPARWIRRVWAAYAALWALARAVVLPRCLRSPAFPPRSARDPPLAAQVNAWQVSIGLFLLSISAATALAEERDRGSLDVVMATPLSTREIVRGKWWGTFATVPRLLILPAWVSAALAMVSG